MAGTERPTNEQLREAAKQAAASDASDATTLEERIDILGLAGTQAALSVEKTITPHTLALLRTVEALSSASSSPSFDRIDEESLPRISIDGRGDFVATSSPPTALGSHAQRHRPDYSIVSTIGEGGMGRVHLAHQRSLDRDVALKTLKPDATTLVASALLREARITGALEHPGVIPVHVLGRDDHGRPLLVMKRVDGVDLGTLLAEPRHPIWQARGSLSHSHEHKGAVIADRDRIVTLLEIVIQVCLTVEFAHSRGIIHRDIKPENIMVGTFGEVYLLDWGIAIPKPTSPSAGAAAGKSDLVGTPVYMAPEMALGRAIDERTDVYLLGATLHEVLTGTARHVGKSIIDVLKLAMVSASISYPPEIPEALASLCNRATARDPNRRPQSAREMREELSAFLRHRSARALSNIAFERVVELETLLLPTTTTMGSETKAPKELARAYRLATEARFGFTQSLREDATDETTMSAMRHCIALSIELELRQGHADSAEALLREMDPPDHDLEKRIEDVREKALARTRDNQRLAQLDRDLDPTLEAKYRARYITLLGAMILMLGALLRVIDVEVTPMRLAFVAGFMTFVFGSGSLVFRRRILSNVFNQRLVGLILFMLLAVTAHRAISASLGTSTHHMIIVDMLIFSTVLLAGSVTLLPRLAISAVPYLIGLVLAYFLPERGPFLVSVTSAAALIFGAWALNRAKRPSS